MGGVLRGYLALGQLQQLLVPYPGRHGGSARLLDVSRRAVVVGVRGGLEMLIQGWDLHLKFRSKFKLRRGRRVPLLPFPSPVSTVPEPR